MTAGGREFQVAGAAQLNDRLLMSVCLNGTSRNGTADDRSDVRRLRDCKMLLGLNVTGESNVIASISDLWCFFSPSTHQICAGRILEWAGGYLLLCLHNITN